MPDEIQVTDADREAAATVAKIDFIDGRPEGLSEHAFRDLLAIEIARAMAPERQRAARIEKALRALVQPSPSEYSWEQISERISKNLREARAALGED